MTKQKHLSDNEKKEILTLSAQGLSPNAVAGKVSRNRRTVKRYLDQPVAKELLADMYEKINRQILESVKPEDIEKATLLQRLTSAAIATDKTQLLRGQATSINVTVLLDAVDAIREMRKRQNAQLSPSQEIKIETTHGVINPQD